MPHVWNPNLLIGNARLDEQHQMIFQSLDTLLAAMSEGKGQEPVASALETLSVHVASHFKLEEDLMAKSGYLGLDAHRENHEVLRRQVNRMVDRFRREGLNKVEFINFMQDWVGDHIQKVDKHFVDFLSSSERAAS